MDTSQRIVFASGCFDLFHVGHLYFLEHASTLGDRLIVGVQTDDWIERTKGQKPIFPLHHRLRIISALKCVDVAFPVDGPKDEAGAVLMDVSIRAVGPDHGWLPDHQSLREKMEAAGIQYVTVPETKVPDISTTIIKEKCFEEIRDTRPNYRDLNADYYGLRNP